MIDSVNYLQGCLQKNPSYTGSVTNIYKVVELVCGGCVINGATASSLHFDGFDLEESAPAACIVGFLR